MFVVETYKVIIRFLFMGTWLWWNLWFTKRSF